MQRVSTTVIAVVGQRARSVLEALGRAANIRTALPDLEQPPLERAVAAWSAASGGHTPFLLHDADPLAAVADAWVRWFDEQGPVGELEVVVQETLRRWRSRALELPDYYLVLDPAAWPVTRRHWYLGFLHRSAPSRVLVSGDEPGQANDAIAHLAAGRWWPDLDDLLRGVERVVPDQP
jgi:hypothetical protein